MDSHRPQHLAGAGPRAPRRARGAVVIGVVLVLLVGGGAAFVIARGGDPAVRAAGTSSTTTTEPTTTSSSTTTTLPPPRTATIAFSGDVLIHSGVWKAAATGAGYDFSPMLAPIAPQLSAADLAICHLEVTLARPGDALSSYPRFRAPRELARDLAEAGYDGCSVASNHALDFGEQGVVSTLDALDEAGLAHAGTARSPEENTRPAMYDVGGIAVAQLSYAYGFNGFVRPAGKEWLVDQIDPALILADAQAAARRRCRGRRRLDALGQRVPARGRRGPADGGRRPGRGAGRGRPDRRAPCPRRAADLEGRRDVGGLGHGQPAVEQRPALLPGREHRRRGRDRHDRRHLGGVGVTDVAFTPTWNERATFRVPPHCRHGRRGTAPELDADLRASYERTAGYILGLGAADLGVEPDRALP